MVLNYRALSLFILCLLVKITANGQSGWTKDKGELYSQLSFSQFKSSKFHSTTGTLSESNEFSQKRISLYAEYGISSRFTSIVNLNVFQANKFETTNLATGAGNVTIEFKYALSKKIPIAVSIAPEIPIGKTDNWVTAKKPDQFGILNRINLPTTDGEFNVWSTLAISNSIANNQGWLSGYYSHNFRTEGFSNQFKSGVELGFKPIERLFFKGTFSILSNYRNDIETSVSFIRGEGTRNSSFSLGVGYTIYKSWGVIGEYYQGIEFPTTPKNTYLGPLFSLGITCNVKKK